MTLFTQILKNKNTQAGIYYLFGNVFNKAIAFLTIPIFTRMLSTTDYGIVNTYMSWLSILSLIIGLSLGNSLRSAYIDHKEDLNGFISSIFLLSLINFIITSFLIIIVAYYFIRQIDLLLIILCLINSYMSFVINTMTIKYMMSMEYLKRTLLLSLPNILSVFFSLILIVNIVNNLYLGRIIPSVIVTFVIGSFFLVKYLIFEKDKINTKYWKYALTLSLPLIFHGLSSIILNVSDRIMITSLRSASETGIYSLVYSFGMLSLVITTSLGSVWIPWFNRKLQNNEREIINVNVKIYIEVVLVFMIIILFVGTEILKIMAPPEYWNGIVLIPPIILASFFVFLYSISVDLEYYYKATKIIAVNTMVAAALNLLLNFIFIPHYGAVGAAWTTVLAYILSFAIHYTAARKLDNILFPFNIYILPIVLILGSILISYLLTDYVILRWVVAIVGFIIYVIFSIKNKRFNLLKT